MKLIFKIIIFFTILTYQGLTTILLGQNTVGLILNNDEAFNSYTLFAPIHSTSTYLINNNGQLVKEWTSSYPPGLSVYLLENSNLLRSAPITSDTSNLTGGFQLLSWDNDLIWEYYFGLQHHDVEALPNGNVLLLTTDIRTESEAIQAGRDPLMLVGSGLKSVSIYEISQTNQFNGDIVWEWHAWDHLIQDFDETKMNFGNIYDNPELININFCQDGFSDWLHTNSIDRKIQCNRPYHPII